MRFTTIFPIFGWGRLYSRTDFADDFTAAVIVTIMLIPQSLAYALLAGLPPHYGLYASILPLIAYAIFGSSRALAVGPVAVISLMTAAATGEIAAQTGNDPIVIAIGLAFISGVMLFSMGLLRLGFVANFLSHPVIAGFITASGIIIALSQVKHIIGVSVSGHTLLEIVPALWRALPQTNMTALIIGGLSLIFLFWVRQGMKPLLQRLGMSAYWAGQTSKAGPVLAVFMSMGAVVYWQLQDRLALVGEIPNHLPLLALPPMDVDMLRHILMPAFLISLIGFVESVSVARTLAAKRRQHIDADQELRGLGAANLASAFSSGFPVTGGFARSVVNFDAGAATPAAGALTAIGIALATMFLTPYLYFLPKAVLAATIIVAVLSLVDFSILKTSWAYSKSDFIAVAATIVMTLFLGVEIGVSTGVAASVLLYLLKTGTPHLAEIGLVPGTQHFRNIQRHKVITSPHILSVRLDENMFFINAAALGRFITARRAQNSALSDVILNCSSISLIDASGLESLTHLNDELQSQNCRLHLSEVKGPVMDRLERSSLLQKLTGKIFLSHFDAVLAIDPSRYQAFVGGRPEQVDVGDGSHI
jgi:SulP family sulfate permease